ncbi:MAG: methylenetetrahydrofolate reductase [Clostridia bacterium]|nr:methylenetetrahydrofolate reductase [NAD(P)H] [Clostridia bacterium]
MRISELLKRDDITFSLEVFPPKTSDKYTQIAATAKEIAALKPDFMSVTYGAGGGTGEFTAGIASEIQAEYGVPTLAHLTCVSSSRGHVLNMLETYREKGIENILALRGDRPADGAISTDYKYAVELIRDIRANGDFCIGGACYPEGHIECAHKREDIDHLKEKVDAGLDFLTTQMFFNNDIFYNFLYRVRERGILVPIIPGIMPITSPRQLSRSVAMSGTDVPQRFRAIVDYFGETPAAMRQAGIIYATEQIIDLLANGIRHIHVYTMNKPEVAASIMANLSEILRGGHEA